MDNADHIARKAGFGFSLSKDPITEKEWITTNQNYIQNYRKYVSDNRFNVVDKILKDQFEDEHYRRLSGMVKSESGSIAYAQIYLDRHLKARDQGDVDKSNQIWDQFVDTSPISLAALRRADFALNTNYDFLNRLWFFWINHFTTGRENAAGPYIPQYQETLRKNMFGKFSDLVYKSITHASMIRYLDNQRSAGPNSEAVKKGWTKDGTNENLAREVMELYTLTPARGYTQEDVNGMTNILTGWQIKHWDGVFKVEFEHTRHEPRTQKVLGKNSKNKLKRVVKDLCKDPFTANHIAFKLCQHFIKDVPNDKDVKELAKIYTKTGGDLKAIYKGLLKVIARSTTQDKKFLNPELWLYQAYRTFDSPLITRIEKSTWKLDMKSNASVLSELGHLHGWSIQPNGFPDTEEGWVSNEYMSRRIRLSTYMGGRLSKFKSDILSRIRDNGVDPKHLERLGFTPGRSMLITQLDDQYTQIAAVLCSPEFMRV
jgi:uncharacterized protein (DUF1800 family)